MPTETVRRSAEEDRQCRRPAVAQRHTGHNNAYYSLRHQAPRCAACDELQRHSKHLLSSICTISTVAGAYIHLAACMNVQFGNQPQCNIRTSPFATGWDVTCHNIRTESDLLYLCTQVSEQRTLLTELLPYSCAICLQIAQRVPVGSTTGYRFTLDLSYNRLLPETLPLLCNMLERHPLLDMDLSGNSFGFLEDLLPLLAERRRLG